MALGNFSIVDKAKSRSEGGNSNASFFSLKDGESMCLRFLTGIEGSYVAGAVKQANELGVEVAGVGIQWHTFSQSPVEGDDFNLLLAVTMLMVDAVVYGVLTWYIEAVHPGTEPFGGEGNRRRGLSLGGHMAWGGH